MSSPSLRVYVLYPRCGRSSVQSIDYHETLLYVAARSVRQAYALAHGDEWIHPPFPSPVGIVARFDAERGRSCGAAAAVTISPEATSATATVCALCAEPTLPTNRTVLSSPVT